MIDIYLLDNKIAAIDAEIADAERHKAPLVRERDWLKAKLWLEVNEVTREQIQSSHHDVPWFGHVSKFCDWLKENSTKRFAEWNHRIYFRADLVAGEMPSMPATLDDLKRLEAERQKAGGK